MSILIQQIDSTDTWPIRHRVMWPEKPMDYIQLAQDPEGWHYGLFVETRLVSVVSLFFEHGIAQFRKFATEKDVQGKGYGSQLLAYVMVEAEKAGARKIWCNARVERTGFYERFGLQKTDEIFYRGKQRYVVMEKELFQF
ncbi:MAG: GNAT family N-acetyltransferase [Bacteroidota bacterium]